MSFKFFVILGVSALLSSPYSWGTQDPFKDLEVTDNEWVPLDESTYLQLSFAIATSSPATQKKLNALRTDLLFKHKVMEMGKSVYFRRVMTNKKTYTLEFSTDPLLGKSTKEEDQELAEKMIPSIDVAADGVDPPGCIPPGVIEAVDGMSDFVASVVGGCAKGLVLPTANLFIDVTKRLGTDFDALLGRVNVPVKLSSPLTFEPMYFTNADFRSSVSGAVRDARVNLETQVDAKTINTSIFSSIYIPKVDWNKQRSLAKEEEQRKIQNEISWTEWKLAQQRYINGNSKTMDYTKLPGFDGGVTLDDKKQGMDIFHALLVAAKLENLQLDELSGKICELISDLAFVVTAGKASVKFLSEIAKSEKMESFISTFFRVLKGREQGNKLFVKVMGGNSFEFVASHDPVYRETMAVFLRELRKKLPLGELNVEENYAHVKRLYQTVLHNGAETAEVLGAQGFDGLLTGILGSDIGKGALQEIIAMFKSGALKLPGVEREWTDTDFLAAFLRHEDYGLNLLKEEMFRRGKALGLSEASITEKYNVARDAIINHNGPATPNSWWANAYASQNLGTYDDVVSAEGWVHALLDRMDQMSVYVKTKGNVQSIVGGPRKILWDNVTRMAKDKPFSQNVLDCFHVNAKGTNGQIDHLFELAKQDKKFEKASKMSYVQEIREETKKTIDLYNEKILVNTGTDEVSVVLPDGTVSKVVGANSEEKFKDFMNKLASALQD